MRTRTKVWLIIAAFLVVVGLTIFSSVMSAYNWDFTKLSTGKYETNAYEINEEICGISINTDSADIIFAASDDDSCRVVCYEQENIKHSVDIQEGNLIINIVDDRKWYEYIGINFGVPKITVYVPQGKYGKLSVKSSTSDVEIPKDFQFESIDISGSTGNVKNFASALEAIKIKTGTGNIRVENASANSLELSVSTGEIAVSGVTCKGDIKIDVSTGKANLIDATCKSVISNGNTGDISLKNVIATEKFSIERSTGDVRFDGSDAAEIFVETDTGDIIGTLLSKKVFITQTDTGRIEVPKTTNGGRCEINTDTGDIKININ